jgi:hypothetical protein
MPESESSPEVNGESVREDLILVAIEARRKNNDVASERAQYEAEKDVRQEFRALIDPGIMRSSRRDVAMLSMRVSLTPSMVKILASIAR